MTVGVMARDRIKTYVTKCPTYTLWFERFAKGMHSRMGDDRRPDAAISIKLMKALDAKVDQDYLNSEEDVEARYITRAGLFFMGSFLGSLRGEETPRLLRKWFIRLNQESLENCNYPHTVLPLYGNFKGEGGVPRCYIRRIVCISKSGLNMEKWVRRSILHESDSNTKYLFSKDNGRKQKGGEYEDYMHRKLENIQQEESGLIPRVVDVREAYGISRSFRRGSTTAASNAPNNECDDNDIKRNNRWRVEDRAGTRTPDLDMLQLYTDTLQSIETELKFSKCL